jgi:HEAT repeat protein
MFQPDIEALRADCHSDDPEKQVAAVLELIKRREASGIPDLIPLLASPDELVRTQATHAIGILGSAQASSLGPLLLPVLSDSNEQARNAAVEALGLLIYPPASSQLIEILHNDSSWRVRASAAEALGSYQDMALPLELEQVLYNQHETTEVQVYAARSLGRIIDASHLLMLDSIIARGHKELRVQASLLAAGYRQGRRQYLDELLDWLREANESESCSLLKEIQYLVEDNQCPALLADSMRIRAALQTTALRWPLTARQTQEIGNRLSSLYTKAHMNK